MEAFNTKRTHPKKLAAILERSVRAQNPLPYRSSADKMRTRRALDGIKERINHWLLATEDRPMKGWLFHEGTITEKAEEHYYLAKEYYDMSKSDQFGYLEKFHDANQKATNRITVASWYVNELGGHFYVVKVIHSPLPCKEWGRLPLSRKMWNVIVLEMMCSHQLWQWIHAVREYTNDDSFQVGGIVGWHMERAKKLFPKGDTAPCTGQVIYSHIIQKFSELQNIK